jgi:ATP-dependent helicase/nuclease subunit A
MAAEVPTLASGGLPPVHDLRVGAAHVRLRLSSPASAGDVLLRGPMSVGPPPVPSYLRGAGSLERAGGPATRLRPFSVKAPAAERISTWSYTSLSELERCGYRYYLERELGMSEDPRAASSPSTGGTLDARARGTLVHALLERLDFRSPSAPSAEEVARNAVELGTPTSGKECEEVSRLISGALAAPGASRLAAAVRVRRESPFAFALHSEGPGGQLVTGVIDLLADERDGGCLLVDYKSDRVARNEDLSVLVEREYGVQRLLYALAVLRDGAPKVEIVHWFLECPEDWVSARYAAADRSELEEHLAVRIQHARARMFAVSEHPHRGLCETCPGRSRLCSWSDAETLRETPGDRAARSSPSGAEIGEV